MKFANGKTRNISEKDSPAIWLPEPAYDRLKFEASLPATARNYIETLSADYPQKSLPGYPCQPTTSTIMPRLIYATWPFFVPYYSPCSFPATTYHVSSSTETNSVECRDNRVAINQPQVDANYFTKESETKAEELSKRIKEQIKLNEQLLNQLEEKNRIRARSEERPISCCSCQHHKCHTPETIPHNCISSRFYNFILFFNYFKIFLECLFFWLKRCKRFVNRKSIFK